MKAKSKLLVLFSALFLLTACGDDLDVTVSAVNISTAQVSDMGTSKQEGSGTEAPSGVDGSGSIGASSGTDGKGNAEASTGNGTGSTGTPAGDETGGIGASSGTNETASIGVSSGLVDSGVSLGEEVTGMPEDPANAEIHITISAAGDVTMGNYLGQGYESSFRYTYDQGVGDSYFFENVLDIFEADDLTLVNLEGPLTLSDDPREGQTYTISGDPEYVNILTAGSVEAVSMGNNHRLDYKQKGSDDTVAALEEVGIPYAYDDLYCLYEVKGIKIGIVSVNEVAQGYGVEKYLQDGIAKLREEGAHLVLTCCHWGIEREYYPETYQESLGKKCIDWGADLVIGCHPHVLQGVEEYKGKFIVYSLGNFCFGANRNPADKDCMIFQQTFTFIGGEKQEDKEIRAIPCSVSSVQNRNDYKPTPATGDQAQRIIDKINECSKDMGVQFDSEGYLIQNQ